jgi:hypothetical protein
MRKNFQESRGFTKIPATAQLLGCLLHDTDCTVHPGVANPEYSGAPTVMGLIIWPARTTLYL